MNMKIESSNKIKENFKLVGKHTNKRNANTNAHIHYNNLEEEDGEDDLNYLDYENSNNLNNYSFLKFLKFDLKRKIKASDISWESEEFDINDPHFTSEDEINQNTVKEELEASKCSNEEKNIYGNGTEVNNLISAFEKMQMNNINYLKNENEQYNRNKKTNDLYYNLNINSNLNHNSAIYSSKKNVKKILIKKPQIEKLNKKTIENDEENKEKKGREKIDFEEILEEINRIKLSSDGSQNNLNFNNNFKNDKINMNEDLNFSNNAFPYRTIIYSSEILSSENISLMQNVSEINHENNISQNKKQELDNSDRNINLNDYSFSRINSVNHSYNISSFMKRASNQTIETINRNSKNGFYSKKVIKKLSKFFYIKFYNNL